MTYKPKQLSAEAFEELRTIAGEEMDGVMADEDIEQMGVDLLRLFSLLATPEVAPVGNRPDERELKALIFLRDEIAQGRSPSIRELSRTMGFRSSRSGYKLLKRLIVNGWAVRSSDGKRRLIMLEGAVL